MKRWIDNLDELAGLDMVIARQRQRSDAGGDAHIPEHHAILPELLGRRLKIFEFLHAPERSRQAKSDPPRCDFPRRP